MYVCIICIYTYTNTICHLCVHTHNIHVLNIMPKFASTETAERTRRECRSCMHPQLLATEGMRLCVRAKVYGIHLCVSLPSELQFSHHAFQAVSLLRSFLLQVAHHLCVHACLRFHTLGDARASSHVCTVHSHTDMHIPSSLVCCISSPSAASPPRFSSCTAPRRPASSPPPPAP